MRGLPVPILSVRPLIRSCLSCFPVLFAEFDPSAESWPRHIYAASLVSRSYSSLNDRFLPQECRPLSTSQAHTLSTNLTYHWLSVVLFHVPRISSILLFPIFKTKCCMCTAYLGTETQLTAPAEPNFHWEVIQKFVAFYWTQSSFTVFIRLRHKILSWARLIQSSSSYLVYLNLIVLSAFHLRRGLQNGPFENKSKDCRNHWTPLKFWRT